MLPRGARVARASARAARRDDFARRRVGAAKPTARRRATTTRDEGAPHASVMMDEVLEAFRDVRARTHVDGTLGAGGHARAMIEAHEELSLIHI